VAVGVPGVVRAHLGLHGGAWRTTTAVQAGHLADPAVQLDQVMLPRSAVQTVDVLGDHQLAGERGQEAMPGIRLGRRHPRPAHVGAGPVAPLVDGGGDELLVGHRHPHRRRVDRTRAAIVRDAGVRGDAGAGQRDEAPTAQQVERTPGVVVHA